MALIGRGRPAVPRWIRPVPGPRTWTVTLGGVLTSSGTLSKTLTKALTGAQTDTGSLVKAVTKTGLSGTLTSSGTVAPLKVKTPSTPLSGTLTSSGSINNKQVGKVVAGTLTSSGTVLKATTRKLSGPLTSSGTVAPVRLRLQTGAGTVTSSGTVLKTVIKPLSGTLTSNGGVPKTVKRVVGGTLTPSGSVIPVRLPVRGTWVSAPIPLPTAPLAGTLLAWTATIPAGATLTVETSVDNGASWQTATNQDPIPNLSIGITVLGSVMVRVTMTRTNWTVATPSLTALNVRLSSDQGVSEYCPLGVFLLDDVAVTDTASGAYVEIAGADLSRKVDRNAWDTTYTVQPGTNYSDAIAAMLQDRMPDIVLNFASTEQVTPQLQFGQSSSNSPWQDVQQMAQSIGYEVYFDARGVCVLRAVPDPDVVESQWEFEDTGHPVITSLVRRISDSNTYSKVIATGEGTGNDVPVQAIAIDDDPASPTYYLGAYGTVTYRFSSPLILTTDQAQAAADAMLRSVKGATEAVEIDVVPMPAVEPGDVVTVTRGRSRVEGRFLIDQVTTPLDPADTMHLTARRQRA